MSPKIRYMIVKSKGGGAVFTLCEKEAKTVLLSGFESLSHTSRVQPGITIRLWVEKS